MERLEPKDQYAVGIVGIHGLVGQNIAKDLRERGFPVDYANSKLFSSKRHEGRTLTWGEHVHIVQHAVTPGDYEGLDFVFLSAGGDATKSKVSKEDCPKVVEAGGIAIDNSSAWRQDPEVPLVVAEVNPEALNDIPKGIIANPNCTTMIGLTALAGLHKEAGLTALSVSTLQSVSGQGRDGVLELRRQSIEMMYDSSDADNFLRGAIQPEDLPQPQIFPAVVGSNVAAHAGSFVGRDTTEELKFVNESRKILGLADLAVQATCWRVPVINGHSMTINAEFEEPLTPERADEIIEAAPGAALVDVPQPAHLAGRDEVLVGRIREDTSRPDKNALVMTVSGDNVRKGASLNAVQIAELLIQK